MDLSALLRAVGVKDSQGFLDLLEVVQPTVQVADVSKMGPAIIPPMSVMGVRLSGELNKEVHCVMQTLAQGGSWVNFSVDTNSDANAVIWAVTTPVLQTSPLALTNFRAGHQPSLVTGGMSAESIPLLSAATSPTVSGLRRGGPLEATEIYVPHGLILIMRETSGSASTKLIVSSLWRDVPVPPGADALTAALP